MSVAAGLAPLAAQADPRPPNIILIMADDVGWECFSSYGAQEYRTPHIDRLAEQGVRFENCFSTPLCTPSRVQIMTGRYSFRNYTHFDYLNPAEKTFGNLLQEAGYKTAIAGKWQLNGIQNQLEGYNDNARPHRAGFDEYCLWQLTRDKKDGERYWNPAVERNGTFISSEENHGKYGPDIFSDFICDFIGRNSDRPFFAYYPMALPHWPFLPTPDTRGDLSAEDAAKEPEDTDLQKENFVAMVEYMDKLVGKIYSKVEEIGQLENTIILFTADNGTSPRITSLWNGREIQGGKGTLRDAGTHVPLVACWPGRSPAGAVFEDLIDFTDMYATFADSAGVSPDRLIDGQSFLPRLQGLPGKPRDWILCYYQPYWGKLVPGVFVREQTFKLYGDGRFYRPDADLFESTDIKPGTAGEPADVIRRRLQDILDRCPPVPQVIGNKEGIDRPVYPDVNLRGEQQREGM